MRQVTGRIPTYSSDEFGICSALYELGGMVVMHDASGCNSTYTTHDEPRWYDMDSMIYISAISEMEAILGDDDKLLDDLIETANELHPKFIAVVGAPIPYMIGTDLRALAQVTERRTGIPAMGFQANGMQHYTTGISMALEWLVKRFCRKDVKKTEGCAVNIIGATPLDFSINGSVEEIGRWITDNDMKLCCCMAMGSSLEEIGQAGAARVNLVVSYGGLAAARYMESEFGIPYVVGAPLGDGFAALLAAELKEAARTGVSSVAYEKPLTGCPVKCRIAIIGESVISASLGCSIEQAYPHVHTQVLCPVDTEDDLLRCRNLYSAEEIIGYLGDMRTPEEDDLIEALKEFDAVIADPMYQVICPPGIKFYPLPHVACSGRCYEKDIPNLIAKKL